LLLNADFYRWQFESAPDSAAAGGDQSVVAVDENGRLLSFLGLVLSRCSFQGRSLRGAHIISWLATPEARGHGLGRLVMSSLLERFDFLFSRSPRPASLAVFRRLGFRCIDRCGRWIAVLDPDATLGLAVDASDAAIRRARARTVGSAAPGRFGVGRTVPPGAPSLASAVLGTSMTFDRTPAYLRWRYERHPCHRYDFLWVGEPDAPDGVAVVRAEDVSGRPGRVLRVVEFLADPAHSVRLATAVLTYGREQSCAFADIFGASEHFVAGFVAAGGFDALEEPDLRLPHLFQPWIPEVETPLLLFFGRRPADGESPIGFADDMSLIHISKGDGNMDWPSWDPAGNRALLAPPVLNSGGEVA
jgi:GNAT superfamily N-acetyltransferase